MMNKMFDIDKFNVIQDDEYYYFFRALNMGDNSDVEKGITSENGRVIKIRTDRARWEEDEEKPEAKYKENDPLTLEQMYDHIKMHQRKDTNCISLSSNANVSISYGRAFYKDKYVIVKVPKTEYGKTVHNAGEYLISTIEKRVEEAISKLPEDSELLEKIKRIDNATSIEEIINSAFSKYQLSHEEKVYTSANSRKTLRNNIQGRFSSYQTLSEEQNLEKNKIFAKLTMLEYFAGMAKIIPRTSNNVYYLIAVRNAFNSLEFINYGDIEEESIIEIQSKIMDIFALLQK